MSEDYDTQGFDQAYKAESGLHQQGDTLYVAGTRNMGHVGEWWKMPFHRVRSSELFQNMENIYQKIWVFIHKLDIRTVDQLY